MTLRLANRRGLLWLTALAVFSEVAMLVASYRAKDPIALSCLLLAAYQGGYLLADRHLMPTGRIPAITAVLLGLMALLLGRWSPVPAAGLALVLSATVQTWRRQLKPRAGSSASTKNVVKFLAMLAGGIAAFPLAACVVVVLAAVVTLTVPSPGGWIARAASGQMTPVTTRLAQVEFVHHLHYFLYVYVFWSRLDGLPLAALGLLFSIGWVAYFVAEALLRERWRFFSPGVLAVGHLLCAFCIVGIVFTKQVAPTMALWFLTGLGGGSAYMLGNGPQHPKREKFEDAGHVLGALGAAAITALATPAIALLAAAVAATVTALLALSVRNLRKVTTCP